MALKSKKISRRKFLVKSGTLMTSLGVSANVPSLCWGKTTPPVKVSVLAPSHCALPMIYADLNSFYKENGLKVEIEFASSMAEIAKGLLQGRIHFGQMMTPLVLAAHMGLGPFSGQQQPLVSPMWAGTNGGAMVVRPDAGIKLPRDLKGKTIGIHSRFLFHYLITMELLEKHKLEIEKDVSIKIIDMSNMIAALKKGEIDAFINAEPLSTAAVAKGVGRDFLLTKDLWFRHPCCCLAAKKSLFAKEKNLFNDFVSATMRSALALNTPAGRQEKLQQVWESTPSYQKLPLQVIQKAFTPGRTDFDPFPYRSSIKIVGKLLKHNALMPQNLPFEKIVEEVFLSDYARDILTKLQAKRIPLSNDRPESVMGRNYS